MADADIAIAPDDLAGGDKVCARQALHDESAFDEIGEEVEFDVHAEVIEDQVVSVGDGKFTGHERPALRRKQFRRQR